jgi:hypothetical protein
MIEEMVKTMPFPKQLADARQFGSLVLYICDIDHLNGETIRFDAAGRLQYQFSVGYEK